MATTRSAGFRSAVLLFASALLGAACAAGSVDDSSGSADTEPSPAVDASDEGQDDAPPAPAPDAPPSDSTDAGAPESSAPDSSAPDASPPDSSAPDASPHDSSAPDSSAPDSSAPDSSRPDSSAPDASAPDASPHDASPPDSSVTCAAHGTTGALAVFDLSAQPGSEATAQATTLGAGVASGSLGRASALTPVSGSGSMNSGNWPLSSSADPTRYYAITLAPQPGCALSVSSIALDVRASTTGAQSGDIATSGDGFAAHTAPFAGTSTPTVAVSVSGSGTIELRVYGYAATSSAGTWRIENTLTVSGAVQ